MAVQDILQISQRVRSLAVSATLAMSQKSAELKAAGVERILVMNHAFIYPVGCKNSDVQCVPHPTDDREMYVRFLKLYEKCYELLATEFPEITYWEPGNEFDMADGTFLHPIGWTQGSSNVFTPSEAARITADLCW